jgi:hypothetical protein
MKAIILGIFSVVFGCASTPTEYKTFLREGFPTSLPPAGTRVVVWGNHSGAVIRTLGWLHDHHILGVDPAWIEKKLTEPGFAPRTKIDNKTQLLAAAQSARVPFIISTQVEHSQFGQKFDLMSFGYTRTKVIGVKVRGINTETENVVFSAKAWSSKPVVDSVQVVQDLTTFALQKVWNEQDHVFPHQEQNDMGAQKPYQERVKDAKSYSDERPLAGETVRSETVESLPSNKEASLGLHIASGALSIVYTPIKVVYAGLGGLIGGLAYIVTGGDEHTAQSIWDASLNGTYWITAKHLQGDEAIQFKGEPFQVDPIDHTRIDEASALNAMAE